jgi:hypothetical protein
MNLGIRRGLRELVAAGAAVCVVSGVVLGIAHASAAAAGGPVNVTLNIPADPRPNPCMPGDVVNVSGRLHIVYYVRSDGTGGFHLDQLVDEKADGASLTTGVRYLLSDTYGHSFYAGSPFPTVDTMTHSVELVSQAATPNLIMGYTLHTTVTAGGVPTATVDNIRFNCAG